MRILVACVGNIFASDDGFGSHVAAALKDWEPPAGVRVIDYGIRSIHLAYELMDGYDLLIVVDTVAQQDGPPGTLFVIEPDIGLATDPAPLNPHDLSPGGVMAMIPTLGAAVDRILVVGCQPDSLDEGIGLSGPVADAVAPAASLVQQVVERELSSPASAGRR